MKVGNIKEYFENEDNTTRRDAVMIFNKVKTTIDKFPDLPSFDFSYCKGYCNAIEDIRGHARDSVYSVVYGAAIKYCDALRAKSKNPLANLFDIAPAS